MLAVCAGMQVVGREFGGSDGKAHTGIGLLDCTTDRLTERAVGECVVDPSDGPLGAEDLLGTEALTGFENHGGRTVLGPGSVPLGRVTVGVGNDHHVDGAVTGRVVGTYLHGPVLPRNPRLADALLTWVVGPLDPLPVPLADRLHAERLAVAAAARAETAPAAVPSIPGRLHRGRGSRSVLAVTTSSAASSAPSRLLQVGGGPACWRTQVCMAMPEATPALMERVEPYWLIEHTSVTAARAVADSPGPS